MNRNDAATYWRVASGYSSSSAMGFKPLSFEIEKVVFNDPATIVIWKDNTKTVVKCQEGDEFDPEKGLAMAIAKKALGNKGNYYNVIKTWVNAYHEANPNISINPSEYPLLSTISFDGTDFAKKIRKAFGMIDQDD